MSSTHFAEMRQETMKREFDYVLSLQFTLLTSHNQFRPFIYSCHPRNTSTVVVYHLPLLFLLCKWEIFAILLQRKLQIRLDSHIFFLSFIARRNMKLKLFAMFIKESTELRTLDAGCSSKGVQAENMIQLCRQLCDYFEKLAICPI